MHWLGHGFGDCPATENALIKVSSRIGLILRAVSGEWRARMVVADGCFSGIDQSID